MNQKIVNAYSYIRLSSKKQVKGAGKDRQMLRPDQICQQFGWTLSDQTFADLGVSSFHGKNRLKGALGEFIKLHEQGKLLPHPVLIIEQWDRFSRQDIDESEQAVISLLKSGVAIHVSFSNKTFGVESTKSIADRIEILVSMKQAHDYSANLSKRVRDSKQAKINKVLSGAKININEFLPNWIDFKNNEYQLNDRADVVRLIFKTYIETESICATARELQRLKIPTSNNGKSWQQSTCRKILKNKSTIGFFKDKLIYPPVVSEADFYKVQSLFQKNGGNQGRRSDLVNIFRKIIYCSKCRNAVQMIKCKGRDYAYYRCNGKYTGICDVRSGFSTRLFEEDLFGIVLNTDPKQLLHVRDDDVKGQVDLLQKKKDDITNRINKLIKLSDDIDMDELRDKLIKLKEERNQIDAELTKLKSKSVSADPILGIDQIKEFFDLDDENQYFQNIVDSLKNLETRKKLQQIMPTIVSRIDLDLTQKSFKVELVGGRVLDHECIL